VKVKEWLGWAFIGAIALPFMLIHWIGESVAFKKYTACLDQIEGKAKDPKQRRLMRFAYLVAWWLVAAPLIALMLWIIPWPRE
jgi:hypothetical protein